MKGFLRAWPLILLLAADALSAPAHLYRYMDNPQPVGSGNLSFLVWNVYTATLYAPAGSWRPDGPFALHIVYHMELKGADITSRSVEEMRRQGLDDPETLRRFGALMEAIFPDVVKDTTLTGVRDTAGGTLFTGTASSSGPYGNRNSRTAFSISGFRPKRANRSSAPGCLAAVEHRPRRPVRTAPGLGELSLHALSGRLLDAALKARGG